MNVLAIKLGVELTSNYFCPEMAKIFAAVLDKWPETTDARVWVTEGRANRNSGLHPHDKALDFRTHNIKSWPEQADVRGVKLEELAMKLQIRLGRHYDVVYHIELAGTPHEHIHIEWDQKEE